MAQDDTIRIKVEGSDSGAAAILKRIQELLAQLSEEERRGIQVTARARSEAQQLDETRRRSEASVRSHARSLREQSAAMREQAAAMRDAANANRESARAEQQATQASIQNARNQAQAVAAQTRALQQRTQAQLNANRDEARTRAADVNANVKSAGQLNQQLAQQTRAIQQQTQAQVAASRQASAAIQQGTQAQLAGTRAATRALAQQTQAAQQATQAQVRLAAAQNSQARTAAASVTSAARVQTAQINAQARAQAAQLAVQRQAIQANAQMRVAQIQASASANSQASANKALIGSLASLVAKTFAYIQIGRAFMAFVKAGFDFNETIRTATLGIATLITAQAKLYDSQNNLISGSKALDAAMELSTEQVTKLRIAGLQTAATTEQLVTAFQQAVGPGLRGGLNLDQIRQFTVGVTQAAAAIGLPMHQLNEEVRSLLAGTITYNTRIAKTLGITNSMVSAWKQQGVFAERIVQRFQQFNLAGARSMQNLSVLLSNLKEAADVFAGEVTKPLFDAFRESGGKALNSFFDFDKGTIAERFQGIVNVARDIFSNIGAIVSKAIAGAIDLVVSLSKYFDENRAALNGVTGGAKALVSELARVLGYVLKAVIATADWAIQSGLTETILRTVAGLVKLIGDLLGGIAEVLGSAQFQSGLDKVITFLKWTPAGIAVQGIVLGLGALTEALTGVNVEHERFMRNNEIIEEQDRNRAVAVHKLAVEYDTLKGKIDKGKLSSAALAEAKDRLSTIIQQLVKYAPQYSKALTQWGADANATADKVRELEMAQVDLLRSQFDVAKAYADQVKAQRDTQSDLAKLFDEEAAAAKKRGDAAGEDDSTKRANVARKNLNALQIELDGANEKVGSILNAVAVLAGDEKNIRNPTKIVPEPDSNDPKKNNDFKQKIEAAIKEVQDAFKQAKDELDEELDHQEISFKDYIAQLLDAERTAINSEIELRRSLLAHTQDPGEQEKIQADINVLVRRRIGLSHDMNRKLTDLEKELNDEMQQLSLARLRQEEQNGEARRIELEQQYQKLRRVMIANHEDTKGLDAFINIEVARARLDDFTRIVNRATSQAQSRIDEINQLAARGMISTSEQANAVGQAYEQEIRAIERALPAMRALAEASKNEDAINSVKQLEIELAKMIEQQRLATSEWLRLVETGLGGLQSGLTDAFTKIGSHIEETVRYFDDNTGKMVEKTKERLYSLKDFAKDVSLSILRALQQQLAAEFAQNVTNAVRGALGKIGIRIGGDTSAAVLQQSAAKEQVAAATTNVQASGTFAASIAQLGAMVPGLLAGIQAGTAGGAVGNATVHEIGAVAGNGADEAALLTAATALSTAGAALTGAAASLGASMVPSATALTGAAASLSAAAAALAQAAMHSGASGAAGLVNQISSFSSSLGSVAMAGAAPIGAGLDGGRGISGPRRSIAITTTDRAMVMPSFSIPQVSSPRTSRYADGGMVDATVAALSRGSTVNAPGGPIKVHLDVQSNDSHILKVQQSDPGVAVTMNTLRRNRRSAKGIIG